MSISLRARNKTRHFQKFLWKRGAAWFSFKIFFGGVGTETRLGRIWTAITMRLWSIISQSQREASFTWWALAWRNNMKPSCWWKLKLIFFKWLWHVFYMQTTGLYSIHELLHKMAMLRKHILHVPKGISRQPSVMRFWLYDRHPLSIICLQALIWLLWGHLKYNHMFTYSSIWNVLLQEQVLNTKTTLTSYNNFTSLRII